MAMEAGPGQAQQEWKFCQSFGDDNSSDDDLITAVEFDHTGNHLAVGDKAGRICIFQGKVPKKSKRNYLEYKFYTEYQSHQPEFDCLKSLEIEERINMVKWLPQTSNGKFIIATNDKTIKLWKVSDKKTYVGAGGGKRGGGSSEIPPMPTAADFQALPTAQRKRLYTNGHQYHLNSISVNSDCETFISADDLRINLWSLRSSRDCFNIVDLKPPNLEELTEVITCANFHPRLCNLFVYSTSRGAVRLIDMRESALCDQHAKQFMVDEDPSNKSFFSEIIAGISDCKFTPDGRYILTRDYLTLKLWDVNMENKPIAVVPVHEYLKTHLCDLYENDCIFDRFGCAASPDGRTLLTGSYNNSFMVHDRITQSTVTLEALQEAAAKKRKPRDKKEKKPANGAPPPNVNTMDFTKKAIHVAWHPSANTIAVAAQNKLYIYQTSPEDGSSSADGS